MNPYSYNAILGYITGFIVGSLIISLVVARFRDRGKVAVPAPHDPTPNTPVTTFFNRHKVLLVLTALAVAACLNDWLFLKLGALLYIPAAAFVTIFTVLFIIHLQFTDTIDKDIHGGRFIEDWNNLTSSERAKVTAFYIVGFALTIGLVAAAVGK